MKTSRLQIRRLKSAIPLLLPLLLVGMSALAAAPTEKGNVPTVLEGDALVRRNGNFYNNRPLYGGHGDPMHPLYWVFAGDRPLLMFGGNPWMDGYFLPGFQNAGGTAKWLMDFKSVEARYPGGRMEWVVTDPEFPGISITLRALPLGTGLGMAAQAQVAGARPGDKLVWLLGSAYRNESVNLLDPMSADGRHVRDEGFNPAKAEGNRVEFKDGVVRLEPPRGDEFRYSLTACSAPSELRIADADQWQSPATLLASTAGKRPVACGVTPVAGTAPITWVFRAWFEDQKEAAAPKVAEEFRAAWDRVEALRGRVVSKTPDVRFDFMVQAASVPADALWNGTAFRHGCISAFPIPLLGWRSTLAGATYGWHDRVLGAARYFFASQVTGESYKAQPELSEIIDKNEELTRFKGAMSHPGNDPRFQSKGRLIPNMNSTLYDMQSQFVDAVIESWRFTADPEMEKLLRPALELHLDYIDRCFDPNGTGTYESISNTFLTDAVWFNGGGTPEETGFAWRGHLAARDMARRAGDEAGVKKHEAKLELIRKGFFGRLWVDRAGHPGAYREQGGHQRLHDEAWLPGLYLPLDSPGLLNDEQMASTVHFTEYALQRETRPSGGVRLLPSNWVPTLWSNRIKSPGDEYHLALGYCFAGMPEGAFEIINGNISEGAIESGVPANLGVPYASCGTDFGDCVSAFNRVVTSGVFGYRPDRPNGLVTVAPQFPFAWDHATFEHPEFKLAYQRNGTTQRLDVELASESVMELQIPFCGTGVKSATLNGKKIEGKVKPGFGRSIFVVRTPVVKKAEVVLKVSGELALGMPETEEVEVGAPVELGVAGGRISKLLDAQGVLDSQKSAGGKVSAKIAKNPGSHRVLALVEMGKNAPQYRIFDFNVRDPKAEQYAAEKNLRKAPADAKWTPINLDDQLNGRISEIFLQDYVSPRPDTMSLRLGRDGWGTWISTYVGRLAPGIDLSNTRPERPVPVYDAAIGNLKPENELTLEAWVSVDLFSTAGAKILDLGGFSIDVIAAGGRMLRLLEGTKPLIHCPSSLSGERLTHIAVVLRSGKPGLFYFNGKKYMGETLPVDFSKLSLGPKLRIGADLKGGQRLLGQVARVAVATKAATPEDLKNRTLDSAPLPGAVADWRLPEVAAQEVSSSVAGSPALVRQELPFTRPADMPKLLPVVDGMLEVPQGAHFKWVPGAKDIAFTSLWDNWPKKVEVPVNQKGDSVWLLVAGSTNPMQVGIANGVLRFHYADGVTEELELVNPKNFWALAPFSTIDYNYASDRFSLPQEPPSQVQLGGNCRAMVYGWKLRPGVELKNVTLESLSQEVVIGLMGLSICNP